MLKHVVAVIFSIVILTIITSATDGNGGGSGVPPYEPDDVETLIHYYYVLNQPGTWACFTNEFYSYTWTINTWLGYCCAGNPVQDCTTYGERTKNWACGNTTFEEMNIRYGDQGPTGTNPLVYQEIPEYEYEEYCQCFETPNQTLCCYENSGITLYDFECVECE